MNCFEWQTRASDYLDGTLIGGLKRDADRHLDSCRACAERYKRFRVILESIGSQPRTGLPIPIRKAPLARGPRFDASGQALVRDLARIGRLRWRRLPWYLRTSIEGSAIVALILLGVSSGPRIRALYERSIERSLGDFAESLTTEPEHAPAAGPALARGNVQAQTEPAEGDEYNSEGESDDSGEDEGTAAVAGKGEIWRLNVKTDSPHEIRTKIIELLTELKIASTTPGFGGIEAPGGIQFDLLLPQAVVAKLKSSVEKLAPPAPPALADSPAGETFTWYKNRSKKPIPDGKTRVVIWLSQM